MQKKFVEGLEVYGKQDIISVLKVFKIQGVIFAMPSIANKIKQTIKIFVNKNIFIAKVPEISELITNQKKKFIKLVNLILKTFLLDQR